jgi:hypothetical protein
VTKAEGKVKESRFQCSGFRIRKLRNQKPDTRNLKPTELTPEAGHVAPKT